MNPQPSIGRIVHYVTPDGAPNPGEHLPAIVTHVWKVKGEGTCNLLIFKAWGSDLKCAGGLLKIKDPDPNNGTTALAGEVKYDALGTPGTWHWPERE